MKNTIYLDSDFNFLLLECEESSDTRIYINLTTSDAANQRFEISVAGGATVTETIQSETEVNFRLSQEYWADGNITTIKALNDDVTGETMAISFPAALSTNGSLNFISPTEFEMSAQSPEYAGGGSGSSSGAYGSAFDFVEAIRNIGFRLLDEPSSVNVFYDFFLNQVSLKWVDPSDIIGNEPAPATWAGTVVVRKEGSAPRHKWDGVLIEDSTTRNAHASSALIDATFEEFKTYYYGIFPYDTKGDYRFTKSVLVVTGTPLVPVPLFENGAFVPGAMADGFSLTNRKANIPSSLGGSTDISTLSEWYLSEFVLWCGNHFAEPFYIESDYLRKDGLIGDMTSDIGEPVSFTGTYYYLPIKRINNPKILAYKGATVKYNGIQTGRQDYNFVSLGVGAVVEGQMQTVFDLPFHVKVEEWTEYQVNISSLPYVDYLILWAADGSPGYKDIEIRYQEV